MAHTLQPASGAHDAASTSAATVVTAPIASTSTSAHSAMSKATANTPTPEAAFDAPMSPFGMSLAAGMSSSLAQMSTPEAQGQWGSSSTAPFVTLTSDATSAEQDLFDPINRPYTPSYNSVGDFSDILSDQQDFLRSVGDQIDDADFAFDDNGKAGGIASSFDYDPDTADSYNHLTATLLSQSVLSGTAQPPVSIDNKFDASVGGASFSQNTDGLPTFAISQEVGGYRDPTSESHQSPTVSPLLGPVASPLHTRNSSFGSSTEFSANNGEGDPAFQQMQSLGQRMTLHDPVVARHPGGQESGLTRSNDSSPLRSMLPPPLFAPVFDDDAMSATDGRGSQDISGMPPFPSYTYSSAPADENATMLESREQQQQQQSIDGQSQQHSLSGYQMSNRSPLPWMMSADQYANDAQAASYASLAQHQANQQQSGYGAATPSSSGPEGSRASQQQQQQQQQHKEQQQQQENPRRQDSYERVQKFLRLDVDMGFQADREMMPSDGTARKRSNSDAGPYQKDGSASGDAQIPSPPPFAVVSGGVSDRTPIAMTSGVDWATEAAKQRRMDQLALLGFQSNSNAASAAAATMGLDPNNAFLQSTMDPNLLQQQELQQQQQQQQQQNLFQQAQQQQPYFMQPLFKQEPASGPVRQRENSATGRGAGPYAGAHGRNASSGSLASFTSPFQGSPSFASGGAKHDQHDQNGGHTVMHRSSSASRGSSRGHHSRLAQSEDLSQMARMSNPSEFLHRITAPDGSLAPPNTQPGGMPMGPPGSSRNSLSRINTSVSAQNGFATAPGYEYNRLTEDLYDLQSMNRYGSIRESPGAPHQQPMPGTVYSQTQSPTYGALYTPDMRPGTGPSPYESEEAANGSGNNPYPIVQQVTTSATQAASASRRKNEALHVCPIPGCGSTFTRKFNLNGHIRSHTGQRPYQCRVPGCNKSFARSFDLSRHEKLHAGIKPHQCDSCGKAFARADALSRHLRNDAGIGGCASRSSDTDGSTVDGSSQHGGERDDGGGGGGSHSSERRRTAADGYPTTLGDNMLMRGRENRFKGHVL